MNIFYKIHSLLDSFICKIIYPTKGKYELWQMGNVKIKLRVGSSDKFAVWEVFGSKVYPINSLKQTSVLIDIGAHIGTFSIYAASKQPTSTIYSFEPDKDNFEVLQENIRINNFNNIKSENIAVSDLTRKKIYYKGENGAMNSFYNKDYKKPIQIDCIGIVEIINQIGDIDYFKMDCEGAEYEILQAISDNNLFPHVKYFVMEYHSGYREGYDKQWIVNLLRSAGYKVEVQGGFLQNLFMGTGYITAYET